MDEIFGLGPLEDLLRDGLITDILINGLTDAPYLPLVLALLSVAGVMLGILLRIQSFLFLGTTFLLVSLAAMIQYATTVEMAPEVAYPGDPVGHEGRKRALGRVAQVHVHVPEAGQHAHAVGQQAQLLDLALDRAAQEQAERGAPVSWLSVDREKAAGPRRENPPPDAIPPNAPEHLNVEL